MPKICPLVAVVLLCFCFPLYTQPSGAQPSQSAAPPDIQAPALQAPTTQATTIRKHIEHMHSSGSPLLVVGDLTLAKAVAEFYERHYFNLMWTRPELQRHLIAALESTAGDGLNPDDYHLAELKRGVEHYAEIVANGKQDDFDLLATDGYLRALIHLFRGKVDPKSLDARWRFAISDIAPARALDVVSSAVETDTIAEAFALARPQHQLYGNLRNALTSLRAIAAQGGWPELPDGPALKPGMHDARVPLLRRRLALAGLAVGEDAEDFYDPALVAAVKHFQREQLLEADGAIGKGTRAALNISIQQRIDQTRADLERARWLLHGVQGNFVLVNAAGFKVSYFRGDTLAWSARVQVGMPARDTPIFKSTVSRITFNPNWTVPPTILREDILPKVRRNPAYLAENHIRVFNDREQPIPPAQIDWNNPGNITLRQDAGPHSALGRAAIRFPNPYSIYLHDTPHQELFDSHQRTFSSGCIRVERALELVELLLDDSVAWNRAAIDAETATAITRNVKLAKPIPILLSYSTVEINADGHISFNPDVYGRDQALVRALNAHDRY